MLRRKLCLRRQELLVDLCNIRVLDMVKKPFLEDRSLLFREHLLASIGVGDVIIFVTLCWLFGLVLELVEALVFELGLARELVIVEGKSGCLI